MSNRSKTILLILIDVLILFLVLGLVIAIRDIKVNHPSYYLKHFQIFSFIFPFWIGMYFIEGMYTLRTFNPGNLSLSLIRGTFFSLIISFIILYFFHFELENITPKTNLLLIGMIVPPLLFSIKRAFYSYFSDESRLVRTMLIGSEENIQFIKNEIKQKPYLGYKIVENQDRAELIVIERHIKDSALYKKIFDTLSSGTQVVDMAKFAEQISGRVPIPAIDESWFVEYCGHHESKTFDLLKTTLDKIFALILIIFLIPAAVILLPVLLLIHGRPLFFIQTRTGLHNKPFKLYKLRTMVIDAEKNGAQWAKPGDARITPLGKFLRKSRLDELPQLLNILKGEMSLIGPRPERPEIISSQLSQKIPFYNLRHLVKPGVTGWAQVTFRYGFSAEDSKEKLQYDLFYVKNRSIWFDILVFFKTIKTVLTGAGQ